MSSYNVVLGATGFSSKDALTAGAALKYLQGVELQAEFNAISTAINSKIDSTLIGAVSGVAGLDTNSRISSTNMPFGYASSLGTALGFSIGVSGATTLAAPTAGNTLTIGQFAGSNQLALSGSTSGTVSVGTAAAAGTWTLTLPTTAGAANSLLQSNGSGVTSWVTALTLTGLTISSGGFTVTGNSSLTGTLTGLTGVTIASGGLAITAGGATVGGSTTLTPTAGRGLTVNGVSGTHSTQIADSTAALFDAGFLVLPTSSNTTLALSDRGKSIQATGTITVPNATFSAGDSVMVYNNSAGSITLTATITTMRLAGSATTGSRTIAQRGWATIYFVSGTECVVGGAGVS